MATQEVSAVTRVKNKAGTEYIVYPATKSENVAYDNGTSGLTADDAQAAIDELAGKSYSKEEIYTKDEVYSKEETYSKEEIDQKVSGAGGGIIVSKSAPPGDASMLWIDTTSGGVSKYWNGSAWVATAAVWG